MTTRFELGESSNPNPNPNPNPTILVTPRATLLECMMVKRVEPSPYKKEGPELPVSIWEGEGDGVVYVRLDIPGANYVNVFLDPSEMCIKYKGVEEEITMHGIGKVANCRVYEGCIFVDGSRFFDDLVDFSYQFCDGVLLFKISCSKPSTSADLGVQLMTQQETKKEQEMKESSYNPLVTQGTDRHGFHGMNDNGAFFLAVDMPGICEGDNLKLNVSKETGRLDFFAEKRVPLSDSDEPYEESLVEPRRKYEGAFAVNTEVFNANGAQFEINHGVFWIRVPRVVKLPVDDCVTLIHRNRMVSLRG